LFTIIDGAFHKLFHWSALYPQSNRMSKTIYLIAWGYGEGNPYLYFLQGKEIYLQSQRENLYGCEWPETLWF